MDSNIIKEPPGPEAHKLLEREVKVFHQASIDRVYCLFSKRVQGAVVEDVDKNTYLDFEAGSGSMSLGGAHPELLEIIKERIGDLAHVSYPFLDEVVIELGEELNKITPGNYEKRIFFECTGAAAVDLAFKLTRRATKRPLFLAYFGAHHGFTIAGVALNAHYSAQRRGMQIGGLVPGITHIPYPYCYRCLFGLEYPDCGLRCLDYVERDVMTTIAPSEDVSGVLFEPIQGPGGIIPPPDEYVIELKKLCEDKGMLFVADEVWTAPAKTGKMYAVEHNNIEPDMLIMGKSLGGGFLPVSAIISKQEHVADLEAGATSSTYNGYPLGCLAAVKTLEIIQRDKMADRAKEIGNQIMKRALEIQDKHEMLGDVRGTGVAIGTEWVKDRKTKEPAPEISLKIAYRSFQKGLVLEFGGIKTNMVKLTPPLIITKEQVDQGLDIFEEAVNDAVKGKVSLPTDWPEFYAVKAGYK